MKIVAIGGGSLAEGATLAIDREIVSLTEKAKPNALFLPTASLDPPEYVETFSRVYTDLGCATTALLLWEGYSRDEIERTIQATKQNQTPHRWSFRGNPDVVREKIAAADLIYVGGGNTRRMIELWRSTGVDALLRRAGERGAVLCGLSAGCICWGRYGNSDFALTEGLGRPTMRMEGLGFLPIAMCPHMDSESVRIQDFQDMMRDTPGVGVGLDDCCALQVDGDRYRILSSREGARGHLVTADRYEVLTPQAQYRPFADLLES